LLAASVFTAWGALLGEEDMFAEGVRAYRRAIREMREDGSLPLETRRGARALWYQRHAISSLAVIAEIAAVQGIDLWAYRSEGRDLHRAIAFLLDAIADPRRVWPYAAENRTPGPYRNYLVQDLGFMRTRPHGRHYMAWAEIYWSRFPDHPQAGRLTAALRSFEDEFRPMIDEYAGGNTTCFFHRPTSAEAAGISGSSTR